MSKLPSERYLELLESARKMNAGPDTVGLAFSILDDHHSRLSALERPADKGEGKRECGCDRDELGRCVNACALYTAGLIEASEVAAVCEHETWADEPGYRYCRGCGAVLSVDPTPAAADPVAPSDKVAGLETRIESVREFANSLTDSSLESDVTAGHVILGLLAPYDVAPTVEESGRVCEQCWVSDGAITACERCGILSGHTQSSTPPGDPLELAKAYRAEREGSGYTRFDSLDRIIAAIEAERAQHHADMRELGDAHWREKLRIANSALTAEKRAHAETKADLNRERDSLAFAFNQAKERLPDYPWDNDGTETAPGIVWALGENLKGVELANDDLHKVIADRDATIAALRKDLEHQRRLTREARAAWDTQRPFWIRIHRVSGVPEQEDRYEEMTSGVERAIAALRAQVDRAAQEREGILDVVTMTRNALGLSDGESLGVAIDQVLRQSREAESLRAQLRQAEAREARKSEEILAQDAALVRVKDQLTSERQRSSELEKQLKQADDVRLRTVEGCENLRRSLTSERQRAEKAEAKLCDEELAHGRAITQRDEFEKCWDAAEQAVIAERQRATELEAANVKVLAELTSVRDQRDSALQCWNDETIRWKRDSYALQSRIDKVAALALEIRGGLPIVMFQWSEKAREIHDILTSPPAQAGEGENVYAELTLSIADRDGDKMSIDERPAGALCFIVESRLGGRKNAYLMSREQLADVLPKMNLFARRSSLRGEGKGE